ncbi:MAG: hypothetical protein ACE361_03575 [Aureliella sp.]
MKADQIQPLRFSPGCFKLPLVSEVFGSNNRILGLSTFSRLFAAVTMTFLCLATVSRPTVNCFAGPPTTQAFTLPRLAISGPRFQLLRLEIQYFDQGRLTKTEHRRFEIATDGDVELEFGHDGIAVFAAIPTDEPVLLTLYDDESKLSEQATEKRGVASLQLGDIPQFAKVTLESGQLSQSSEQLVRSFAKSINDRDAAVLRSLVLDTGARNIEWQTLTSFMESVRSQLGKRKIKDTPNNASSNSAFLDRWVQWEGELGATMLDGPIQFDRGTCFFTLAIVDNKLADVQYRSTELDGNREWLSRPSSPNEYAAAARELLTHLFAFENKQSAEHARSCLAERYRETVPVVAVAQLQNRLQVQFPGQLSDIEFLRADYESLDPAAGTLLHRPRGAFYHLLSFLDGKQAVSESVFQFTSSKRNVGIGLLASTQVTPTWPSAAPEQAESVLVFLDQLRSGTLTPDHFADSVRSEIDSIGVVRSFNALEQLVPLPPLSAADITTWGASVDSSHGLVQGSFDTSHGRSTISIALEGDEVLGLSIRSPNQVWSSLSQVVNAEKIGNKGSRFWNLLVKGEYSSAHALMSPGFRRQLSLEQLRDLIEQAKFYEPEDLSEVAWDQTVISTRLERPSTHNIASYHLLRFQDEAYQPVRCEYQLVGNGWELVDFSSDFVEQLVAIPDLNRVSSLIDALNSEEGSALLRLARPALANSIERPVLRNFLQHTRRVLGKIQLSKLNAGVTALHDYRVGRRFERYRFEVQCENSIKEPDPSSLSQNEMPSARSDAAAEVPESIPMRVIFEDGLLTALQIETDRLAGALAESDAELKTHLRKRAEWLTTNWLRNGTSKMGRNLRITSAKSRDEREEQITRLEQIRGGWLLSLGDLQATETIGIVLNPDQNRVTCTVACVFAGGETRLRLQLGIDAFGTFIEDAEGISPE